MNKKLLRGCSWIYCYNGKIGKKRTAVSICVAFTANCFPSYRSTEVALVSTYFVKTVSTHLAAAFVEANITNIEK